MVYFQTECCTVSVVSSEMDEERLYGKRNLVDLQVRGRKSIDLGKGLLSTTATILEKLSETILTPLFQHSCA